MLTNEVVKGTEVRLRNGFRAEVRDNNKRGSTRLCMVYGSELGYNDDIGSVYSTDIVKAKVGGVWVAVEPTPTQKKNATARAAFGF